MRMILGLRKTWFKSMAIQNTTRWPVRLIRNRV
jgi:hypothetical protein